MPKRPTRTTTSSSVNCNSTARTRACNTCAGCQRPLCQLCAHCRGILFASNKSCLFRLCHHIQYSKDTQRKIQNVAKRSFLALSTSQSDGKRFLQHCRFILSKTHGIHIEWKQWQQFALQTSSDFRVWLLETQQWGTARRVSNSPPRYDIKLTDGTLLINVPPYEFELENIHQQVGHKSRNNKNNNNTTPTLGQPFVHMWRRSSGKIVYAQGKVTACRNTTQYQITMLHPLLRWGLSDTVTTCHVKPEEAQAGYYQAILLKRTQSTADIPFHIQYKVPPLRNTMHHNLPRATFLWKQFQVELQVLASQQAPHAGFGLFACVHTDTDATSMVLPPGIMIDLGVYGPLRLQDWKPWSTRLIKSFIYSYHCGSWFFESSNEDHSVFDMTDDTTGQLHAVAQQNVLVYVNETTGSILDIPSLWPQYDPEGAVHFYLGHPEEEQGPLILPVGKSVELLVDYGPEYERERVRKNYPRVFGSHLQHLQECLAEEDYEILRDLQELSMEETENDVIPFLEGVVESWKQVVPVNGEVRNTQHLERALMVTMILLHEQLQMNPASKTNLSKLRAILSSLCSLFVSDEQMKLRITSNAAYQEALQRILGKFDWTTVQAPLLRRAILSL